MSQSAAMVMYEHFREFAATFQAAEAVDQVVIFLVEPGGGRIAHTSRQSFIMIGRLDPGKTGSPN